jgi:hypothetical protein
MNHTTNISEEWNKKEDVTYGYKKCHGDYFDYSKCKKTKIRRKVVGYVKNIKED